MKKASMALGMFVALFICPLGLVFPVPPKMLAVLLLLGAWLVIAPIIFEVFKE